MDFYYGGYGGYGYGGWYSGREKSRHSKNREDNAKNKFDGIRNKIQTAMIENTMIELRAQKSDTPLKAVPTVVMNNVLSFVFGKNYKGLDTEKEQSVAVAAAASAASSKSGTGGRRARKKVNYSEMNVDKMGNDLNKVSKAEVEADIDFNDMTLYEPGNKVTIPLTKPDYHLTQPCFRDLRKHVKKNPGWDLHRVALSEEEKKAHKPKITRKSTAYFVNAVYKVPGKKKKAKKAPSSKKVPAAKKAPAKKRKAPTKPIAKKPVAKADPEKLAKLEAAIASARSSSDGEVGAKEMQEALAVGYSKFFILAQLEEEEEEEEVEDSKPAAKKTKKSA